MAAQSNEALLPPWGHALAGATGAVLANAVVYPLDMVKTRLQVQTKQESTGVSILEDDTSYYYKSTGDAIQKIMASDGLSGLYSGMTSSLIGVASTNFAYFYWYSVVRTLYLSWERLPPQPPSATAELTLGAVAGALAQALTLPISVITTRQQTQRKGERMGLFETGKDVVKSDDGWSGLWKGLRAGLVLVVNPAITYGAYQKLQTIIFAGKQNLRPWEAFVFGAMCKIIATIFTQPVIVAKVVLQSRPLPSRKCKPFKGFIEVMEYIMHKEGVPGLFRGIGPQLIKALLVQGLLMMVKERTEMLFVLLYRYMRRLEMDKFKKAADVAAFRAKKVMPVMIK